MDSNLSNIVLKRPFQIRNADEFTDEDILEIFVDPTVGVSGPFDYGNEIIKGKMGSGKTMYLRANYIYYLSTLVPQLIEQHSVVLPIYIKLSDFQNIHNGNEIYNKILIKLIQEILVTCKKLQSAEELVKLHMGIKNNYFDVWFNQRSQKEIIDKLNKLTSEEYIEQVSTELNTSGTIGNSLINACGTYEKKDFIELKKKMTPQISDFIFAYEKLLKPVNAQLLILFDEVGSIDKCFFEENGNSSFFETLMNQLRTTDFVRTKIAIYPHTFADVLTETRYGDVILLEDDIYTRDGYNEFLSKSISLTEKYLSISAKRSVNVEEVFCVEKSDMQVFEQIIYATDGNMRRLVQLLDSTLNECYKRCHATERANIDDAISAIKKQAQQMKSLYYGNDLDFLNTLTNLCKKRTTYRFRFPNKSPILLKYTNKSSEFNILKVKEVGSGRRGTTYWFDYSYCLYADIPTHYQYNSERIARSRSIEEGEWITTITTITDELLIQANLPGKIDGRISYLNSERTVGFISDGTRDDYFFTPDFVIATDKKVTITNGRKVRFIPAKIDNTMAAREIELL
ncbi:MAG: hypothetical protein ACI4G1_07615 [Ruminococcus sp.]